MPLALSSTSLKLAAFTAVSSVFGAGLAAIALTHTPQPEPFGGAPIFEIEMFRDAGMSAAASAHDSKPKPQMATKATTSRVTDQTPKQDKVGPAPQQTLAAVSSQPLGEVTTSTQVMAAPAARPPSPPAQTRGGDDRRGAPTEGAQGGAQDDAYEARVIRWIDEHKRHPGRLQGVVTIRFEVDRRGRIRDCEVVASSGDHRLDRIAQQQLSEAAPLPRAPHHSTWQTREITVRLDYRRNEATG